MSVCTDFGGSWFKLEPGKGELSEYFSLITPTNKAIRLFSPNNKEDYFERTSKTEVYTDQYARACVRIDDLKVDKIKFELEKGKFSTSTLVLASQTLKNEEKAVMQKPFSFVRTVSHTSSFEYNFLYTSNNHETKTEGEFLMCIMNMWSKN